MEMEKEKEKETEKEVWVIVHNVAKRHNIGTLARCATAFGVREMILVGARKDFNSFGSHGSALHLSFRHFFSLADAHLYLLSKGCDICGVEIVDGALPVHHHPFKRSTAFLLGNEGTGLSDKELAICDFFVYIPQYGGGTASLNVTVAASIALHHFAVWAGFAERGREGQKFLVAEKAPRQVKRNYCSETLEDVMKDRQSKKESAAYDWLNEVSADEKSEHMLRKEETSCSEQNISQSNPLHLLFDD